MIDPESRSVLRALVGKYTSSFPTLSEPQEPRSPMANKTSVLVSGSTGAFGSNILAALAASPKVQFVYGISRPSESVPDVRERHFRAFRREGLEEALLECGNVRLIEGDLSKKGFGLDREIFEELKASLTHIIHNAWQINFNLPVASFEANIQSVRNLVNFALTSNTTATQPIKLIFISSLGVFRNTDPCAPNKIWSEEHLQEPDSALGLGYTEAKWVSENILYQAARETPLRPTVVRLGQLVGGPSGYWNEREWFAALIKSSLLLGALPNVPGVLSWNRSHVAARALIDMLDTEEEHIHLVHSRPISWIELISIFSHKLALPVVHIDEWMLRLHRAIAEADQTSPGPSHAFASREAKRKMFRSNPAARMINFFVQEHESCRDKPLSADQQTVWTPLVRCEKAIAASPTLQSPEFQQISESDVEQWLANWRRVGFLDGQPNAVAARKSFL